jgi:hypothetical protein
MVHRRRKTNCMHTMVTAKNIIATLSFMGCCTAFGSALSVQVAEHDPAAALAWLNGLLERPAADASAAQQSYFRAAIDGSFSEWDSVPVALDNRVNDNGDRFYANLSTVKVANDAHFLFVFFQYPRLADGSQIVTYLDNDANEFTGAASIIGVEAAWAYGLSYDFRNAPASTGALVGGDTISSVTGNDWSLGREFAIPLTATFASDGSPVFPQSTFTLHIVDPNRFTAAPFSYTLAVPEPSAILLAGSTLGCCFFRHRRSA